MAPVPESIPLKVKLVELRGETSIFVDAEINPDGDLVISGQDVGRAPLEHWGDSDYEYWVRVSREHKDRLLLCLLEQVYAGHLTMTSTFMTFLEGKDIPYQFHSYV